MNSPAAQHLESLRPHIDDCWNRIGVRGDLSCPELRIHIHCRNCPLYAAAASKLLDGTLPREYLDHWTVHVAQPKVVAQLDTESVLVFRIGSEWLALPTHALKEIADVRTIHSLPHRRNGIVLGLVNVRGELCVCISLQKILGIDPSAPSKRDTHALAPQRSLVLLHEGSHAVCTVDEVHSIQRFQRCDLKEVPATVAGASATYTKAMLTWSQRSIGLLDEQLLFYTINRSLASAATI